MSSCLETVYLGESRWAWIKDPSFWNVFLFAFAGFLRPITKLGSPSHQSFSRNLTPNLCRVRPATHSQGRWFFFIRNTSQGGLLLPLPSCGLMYWLTFGDWLAPRIEPFGELCSEVSGSQSTSTVIPGAFQRPPLFLAPGFSLTFL